MNSTQQTKFLDTRQATFRRTKSKLTNTNALEQHKLDPDQTQFIVKGKSGFLDDATPSSFQKAEKEAFKDLSRLSRSNLGVKLDRQERRAKRSKEAREKLEVSPRDSEESIISKES